MKEQILKIAQDLAQCMITEVEAQNLLLGLLGGISESKFIDEFYDSVSGSMYEHNNPHDYSCGMSRMKDEAIKSIGKDLYEYFYSR